MATNNSIKILSRSGDVRISNGPSASVLIDALKYAFGPSKMTTKLSIEFNGVSETVELQILSIAHEDGSGESFIIEANICEASKILRSRTMSAYYNAKHRKGHVHIE